MRLMIVAAGLLFAALAVVIVIKLSSNYLPAQHLDVEHSAYFRAEPERARLVLVVMDVALDGMIVPRVLPFDPAQDEATVELTAALRTRGTPGKDIPAHEGTVTLDIAVPLAKSLVVLDRRWDHPQAHPQGHRFRLRDAPPPKRKSK